MPESTPDSVKNPSTIDDGGGLPSPPLDKGYLIASQTGSIELSQVCISFLIGKVFLFHYLEQYTEYFCPGGSLLFFIPREDLRWSGR